MLRKRIAPLVVVVALALAAITPPVMAQQGTPGTPGVAEHQRGQPSITGPQPPRSNLHGQSVDAPYNGPGAKPPAGMAVPRTEQERQAAYQALRNNPSIQAAADAARTQVAATKDAAERIFRTRTFPLPSEPAASTGRRYQLQPPRSEAPDGAMRLLGTSESAAEQPSTEPLDEPSLQDLGGIWCFIYEEFGGPKLDLANQEDYLESKAVNYCPNVQNTGGEIRYMSVSMHIYKCSAFFTTWEICLAPYHYYELWPPCEWASSAYPYLFCPQTGTRAFYPGGDPYRGAYFLRAYGFTQLWSGSWGSAYQDSHYIAYHCLGQTVC